MRDRNVKGDWVVHRKTESRTVVDGGVEPVRAFHCLSRDGKTLFVAQQHGATYVKAIDTADGKELFPRRGHVAPLNAVAVSPDGSRVASAGGMTDDQLFGSGSGSHLPVAVKVWDVATGIELLTLTGHTSRVNGIEFSPDGKRLASGSQDRTVKIWDVASGRRLYTLGDASDGLTSIEYSPSGDRIAAAEAKV